MLFFTKLFVEFRVNVYEEVNYFLFQNCPLGTTEWQ